MRKELIAIRDKANVLLNAIDGAPKDSSSMEEMRNRVPPSQSSETTSRDSVVKTEGVLGYNGIQDHSVVTVSSTGYAGLHDM